MCDCEDPGIPRWYRTVRTIAIDVGAVLGVIAFIAVSLAAVVFGALLGLGRI